MKNHLIALIFSLTTIISARDLSSNDDESLLDNCKDVVTVATIDTGIDINNQEIRRRIKRDSLGNFVGGSFGSQGTIKDIHGHGTHIADLITREDECIKVMPFSYYINPIFQPFYSTEKSFELALAAAIKERPDIINISGGGFGFSVSELMLIKEAESLGILIVSAAGNNAVNIDNPKFGFFPSSYSTENIISVGAIGIDGSFFYQSNFGSTVSILALGEEVPAIGLNNKIVKVSGTSQATAIVSGAIAKAMLTNRDLSGIQIKRILLETAIKKDELAGKVNSGRVLNKEGLLSVVSRYNEATRSVASN